MHGALAAGHTYRSAGSVFVTHIGANPVVSLLAWIRAVVDDGCLSSATIRFILGASLCGLRVCARRLRGRSMFDRGLCGRIGICCKAK